MSAKAGVRAFLTCASVLLMAGCHTYTQTDAPPPGSTARVRVPIRSAVVNRNAEPQSEPIEGQVVAAGDTIVLALTTRRELGAYREIVQFDTVRVARADAVSIELREFSSSRSVVLGAVIAGGAVGLALAALGIEGGEAGDGPGGDNPTGTVVSKALVSLVWKLFGG